MRFFKAESSLAQKIRFQIFIYLSAIPFVFLVMLGYMFYRINTLIVIISNEDNPRTTLIDVVETINSELFLAGVFCLLSIILQVFLLSRFINRIFPADLDKELDSSEKNIALKIKGSNFWDADNNNAHQKGDKDLK